MKDYLQSFRALTRIAEITMAMFFIAYGYLLATFDPILVAMGSIIVSWLLESYLLRRQQIVLITRIERD